MQSHCNIPDCPKPHVARGWCKKHYQRWSTHGTPAGDPLTNHGRSVEERFWQKVRKTETCWLWQGSRNARGYGQFWPSDRAIGAHCWAYEDAHGPIPASLQLDHLWRTPSCVRPSHLEPVTCRTNILRGIAARRSQKVAVTS